MSVNEILKAFQFIKRLEEIDFGSYYRVSVDEVLTPQGKPGRYHIVRVKPHPMIIPVDNDGNIHMIEEPRYALDNMLSIAFPMGFMEKGETMPEAALRELEEEAGGRVEELIPLGIIHGADGVAEHASHVYLGKGFHFVDDARKDLADAGTIRRHVFTMEQVWQKIDSGEIHAAEALAGVALYFRYCQKNLFQ